MRTGDSVMIAISFFVLVYCLVRLGPNLPKLPLHWLNNKIDAANTKLDEWDAKMARWLHLKKSSTTDSPTNYKADNYLDEKIDLIVREIKVPFPEIEIPDSEIEYLIAHCFNREAVVRMTGLVLRHLNLNPDRYSISVIYDSNGFGGRAGEYASKGALKTINIILNSGISYEQVIAAICHECSHAFLFDKNIKLEPETENEVLTDCTAIYLGFGKQIREGYGEYSFSKWDPNGAQSKFMSRIGYISNDQIDYVLESRNRLILQQELDQKKKEYISQIEERIEQLTGVIERFEFVVSDLSENREAKPSMDDCQRLAEAIHDISTKHYWELQNTLRDECKKASTKAEYDRISCKTEEIAEQIMETTASLGKYL